ncbi:phosphate ABC transporter substrate-binding protein PstS [Parafrankia sp. CH37]|uniref:phosphate ABC transporter substrate-binding protein PstS n=1 Tax=Parafrankia sp. CH37 TaxID=683308 RepID=UPI00186789CC|nr:phosphate ABC transporter substrate-binding protein PstS [Parafrankia sp. CH37]MBE3200526.1 phosphate ABC transporter substrate-binding protein PstS [Parafrankia sp. CH37]
MDGSRGRAVDVPGVDPLDDDDPRTVGPYTVLGRLGGGGMGTVYLARRDGQSPPVALKVIRGDLARVPEFRERFLREAHAAQRVARFCTAEVLDVSVDGRRPYLVTEFIDGPDLSTAVRKRGPLPITELERLAVAVASALTAIHAAGVVHRDLKPGNIMLSSSGARVIDFGIARALDVTTMMTQGGIGTPAFMAPEQALGQPVTAAADVYAWGGVLLFAGTGRLPYGEAPTPVILYRAVNEEPDLTGLDAGLRPLVERAMRKDPAERPTAHDLFLELVGGRPTPAPALGSTAPGPSVTGPLVPEPAVLAAFDETLPVSAPPSLPGPPPRLVHQGDPPFRDGPPHQESDDVPVPVPVRSRRSRGRLLGALASAALVLTLVVVLAVVRMGDDDTGGARAETPGGATATSAASSSSAPEASSMSDVSCATGAIVAEGSTAQKSAMDQWITNYQNHCSGATITYQPTGSGSGRARFAAAQVDFAGSDSMLEGDQKRGADARCTDGVAAELPMAVTPIAIVYNLPGVDGLRLSPATLAGIFSGQILVWNASEISADNPGVKLPNTAIQGVHRSDSGGVTDTLTTFLDAAAGDAWTYGSGVDWEAPGGVGAKGSDGLAATVKGTPNSVGYLDLRSAESAGLQTARIENGAGKFTDVSTGGVTEGLSSARITGTGGDLSFVNDYSAMTAGAYAIYLVTYEIVCTRGWSSPRARWSGPS